MGQHLYGRKKASEIVQVSPGKYFSIQQSSIDSVTNTLRGDLGLYEITQKPEDRWHYKTPSLRNIELTAPYMHNGSLSSLRETVEFLLTLTGANVEELVLDAFTATVGDTRVEEKHNGER
jgi:cytochrome c peroxidase